MYVKNFVQLKRDLCIIYDKIQRNTVCPDEIANGITNACRFQI